MKYFLLLVSIGFLFSCHPNAAEYEEKAKGLLENSQFEETIILLEEAIHFYPDDASLHNLKGVAFFETDKIDGAISEFDISIGIDSMNYRPYYNKGNCYLNKKEYGKAVSNYEKAINLNPKNAELYVNLGNVYYEAQIYTEAISQFEFAVQLDPNSYLGHLNLARILIIEEKYDQAIPHLETCINILPDKGDAFYFLANAKHLSGKKLRECCVLLKKSKELGYQSVNKTLYQLCKL